MKKNSPKITAAISVSKQHGMYFYAFENIFLTKIRKF